MTSFLALKFTRKKAVNFTVFMTLKLRVGVIRKIEYLNNCKELKRRSSAQLLFLK